MHPTMKLILATLLVSSPLIASAVDEHHPEQAPTTPAQTSEAATPMQNNVMTEQMQKLQAAHDKAAAAKTPAEAYKQFLRMTGNKRNGMFDEKACK